MREIGGGGGRPKVRRDKDGPVIKRTRPRRMEAGLGPMARKKDKGLSKKAIQAIYDAMLANAQDTTGGYPGMNVEGRPGVSGFGIEHNLEQAARSQDFQSQEPAIIGDEMPYDTRYNDESLADRALNEHDRGFEGGLRFNPDARLDASQVDDRRFDARTLPVGYDPQEPISAYWRQRIAEMNRRFPGGRISKAAALRRGER